VGCLFPRLFFFFSASLLDFLNVGLTSYFFFRELGQKETSLAGALSPVSKKKTGRAYVSLARAYSEKYAFFGIFRNCINGFFWFTQRKTRGGFGTLSTGGSLCAG